MKAPENDVFYMKQALLLAEEGLGQVWPNPAVGCVIVKDNEIVGAGRTGNGGRPHAETVALAAAGDKACGATVYVTLEPCNTTGQTPPCVDALIKARVARVVIACLDPYQKNSGGIERLEAAGISVTTGVCESEAQKINEGFFKKVTKGRPFVMAKLATSLDGKIALQNGQSQWITGEAARREGHDLRARSDAILVGIGTVLADDPMLTVRLEGYQGRQPARIVIDRDFKLPLDSKLVKSAGEKSPLWVVTENPPAVVPKGIEFIALAATKGVFSPAEILKALAEKGITRLLIEGGGQTIAHFIKAGQLDALAWFRAPSIIGNDGIPGIAALGLESLAQCPRYKLEERRDLGDDLLEVWALQSD